MGILQRIKHALNKTDNCCSTRCCEERTPEYDVIDDQD